ncbi:CPBP family intramembrane metalloprotease [Photobacterium sp. CCB-ST2H9]|uniref:CPBP family intramembrane glutamic endopeptidase n=1 Tax=Photobacterium sp. CCB-ST2H9 TaxID=2912855 RepID=UPI0020041F42|nr:type II CAAX endopeptidase family protein [Photobacterium sp. CCB-ST2H9]UTM59831.1 CPBP family intramembrane metalloprotease [Photobacterium sp. CCB-ST2H9]
MNQAFNGSSKDDFPFYNNQPTAIRPVLWGMILLSVLAGFAVLIAPLPLFSTPFGQFIPAILFFAIPLFCLSKITPTHWRAIFRPVTRNHLKWMLLIGFLNVIVSVVVGLLVLKLYSANPNQAMAHLADAGTFERFLFFLKTLPQLFGEEVFTILPFLALMYAFYTHGALSRSQSVILAWFITAVCFGLAHLPTYDWNLVQCLLVIGTARLCLSLAYIKTKSIWVSTGAHIINDWTLFGLTLMLGLNTSGS